MADLKEKTRIKFTITKTNEEGEKILNHIRERIFEARKEKDYSTRGLSQMMRRSESYISKLENGDVEPGILDLLSLTVILQKPLKYFVPTYFKEDKEELSGEEWELVTHFRNIKDKGNRRFAIRAIEQFAGMKPEGKK